jgi:hypothetical protein
MNSLIPIVAVAVSLAALAYIAAGDAKRRRAFGLPENGPERGRIWLGLAGVCLPAVQLLHIGHGAGFVIWCSAMSVAGWLLAASPPGGHKDRNGE